MAGARADCHLPAVPTGGRILAALIIAALADTHGLGILHYDDDDYEIVGEKTDLRFDGVWLAPRGSI